MVVMILENVPTGLRGELTRWMLEPRAGTFVGTLSARVRDLLWHKVCSGSETGGCTLIYSSNTEQGFRIRVWGHTRRTIADFDGLALVKIKQPS